VPAFISTLLLEVEGGEGGREKRVQVPGGFLLCLRKRSRSSITNNNFFFLPSTSLRQKGMKGEKRKYKVKTAIPTPSAMSSSTGKKPKVYLPPSPPARKEREGKKGKEKEKKRTFHSLTYTITGYKRKKGEVQPTPSPSS